ncbi:DUF3822 family protein [Maribacter antarcticus]|uniref:DUF3822 family protein n=1 Tax=Maribacter antarcticus TaxID=505250 RepID=UPI0005657C6D|nr:DUF3822 family protein [Maribacter antarcticus]
MIEKRKNNSSDIADKNFQKLSIQVSLNGLSFCVADTVSHKIRYSDMILFPEELNIIAVQSQLEQLFKKHELHQKQFDEVTVIHRNTLFCLVPKALFDSNSLSEYLKFNTRVFQTDTLAYDEVENQDMITVYVPYANINNYVYDIFGEFTFLHNGTIIIQSLLNGYGNTKEAICYAHVSKKQLDICVIAQKRLLLYNSFLYETKEDFAYYLLFVLEQLELDSDRVPVKLFGAIEEDDAIYDLCQNYIKNILIFTPSSPQHLQLGDPEAERIDFTVLNTL